jgi:hypothetical protein
MLGALGGFLLIAGPWYAWTIHTTGDPIYPFATTVFGNRPGLWNPAEIQLQTVVQRATSQPGVGTILHQDLRYLAGEVPYDTGANRSPLSWWLGVGLLGLLVPVQRRNRVYLGVLVASVLSAVASLFLSADPRFFVPALGTLSVTVALAVEEPLRWCAAIVSKRPAWRLTAVFTACVATAVTLLWSSIGYARSVYDQGSPPTTDQAVAAYLAPRVACYAVVSYLNQLYASHYRAWGYSCEQAHYYAQGVLLGDAFSVGARDRIFNDGGNSLPSSDVLAKRLAPLHIGWVILPSGTPSEPRELEVGSLFRLVTSADGFDLYKVLLPHHA